MQRSYNQFEISGVLRFEEGRGGLVRAVVSSEHAEAELYLQGAHLTHWQPKVQKPVLFMSPKSLFEQGKAIRGGVPIVFPWFGPRSMGSRGPRMALLGRRSGMSSSRSSTRTAPSRSRWCWLQVRRRCDFV